MHDVTLDYLQPADGLAALSSGHVDAWDIWSPFIEQAQAQDHARLLVNGAGYGSPYSFKVASQARWPTRPRRPRSATTSSCSPRRTPGPPPTRRPGPRCGPRPPACPDAIMAKAAKDDAARAVPITPAVIASEQQVSDAFTAAGLIPGQVDFTEFVDTAFNGTAGGDVLDEPDVPLVPADHRRRPLDHGPGAQPAPASGRQPACARPGRPAHPRGRGAGAAAGHRVPGPGGPLRRAARLRRRC